MKYFELTKEEERLLAEFESGKFTGTLDNKRRKLLEKIAKNTLNKTTNINIRLSEKVLALLKAKAIEKGLPYQTLVSSVLHQYASR